ncbi:MAG: hypothetical protein P4L51_14960 [Puia sp.]|nr:hypothetical protein [Puia sp.]
MIKLSAISKVFFLSLSPVLFWISAKAGLLRGNQGPDPLPAGYFWQEYQEAYPVGPSPEDNDTRSIAIDGSSNIWIATAKGIFRKKPGNNPWEPVLTGADQGPAYAVAVDGQAAVWMGTWNGIFVFRNHTLSAVPGADGPVSLLCIAREGVYALGPKGIWFSADGKSFVKKDYPIARSVRKAVSDGRGGLWVASDVGLYHCDGRGTKYYYKTDKLISAYLRGLDLDNEDRLWAGGLGGVTILRDGEKQRVITPAEGCPSVHVNCVKRSPEGVMWVGTQVGVVRYSPDGTHSLRFSRRWLLDDQVNDIVFDTAGNAWIATAGGVSAIRRRKMSLGDKQDYFYDILMKRHIRAPWIAGQCHLKTPGDLRTWFPEDDDNDGEFTGNYLAMESFHYAATKDPDAREKARKAFGFLKMQEEVTGGDGYFARSIVPVEWADRVHDLNRTFTERERAEEMVKEPRFKPVEIRWRKSKDGKWLWKGDASSDEWCGHMLGYYFFYELAADEADKAEIRKHVSKIVDHVIANHFNMMDVDGTHTRWAVWSPPLLNHDPEWSPDRCENSMEMLAFLKLAAYVTGDQKYQEQYLHLIRDEHYLDNMAEVIRQNPAWFIYYDVTMQAYLYPIFLRCEKDPVLLAFYRQHLGNFMDKRRGDQNPLINFLYCYSTGERVELSSSLGFLIDTPLDLVDWHIDQTKREDVRVVHEPVLSELQIDQLPPPSIRAAVRWDKNPWGAIDGDGTMEREPDFWLLPYWMGRYLKMIP